MPKVVGTVVLGLKDVVAKLNKLPDQIANRAVKRALYAGGGVIRDEARGRVPLRTGALRKAIVVEGSKAPAQHQLAVKVTIARKAFRVIGENLKLQKRKPGERAYRKGDIESVQDKLKAAGEAQDNQAIFSALPVAHALEFVSKATGEAQEAIAEACSVGQIYAAYFQIAGALGASLGSEAGKG